MSANAAKIRVLVVEGDPALRLGLARSLARHPFVDVIGTATTSSNALPKIASFRPDWVIVDMCQNANDGLGMLEDMHEARLETRRAVIARTSGGDTISLLAQARAAGVAAVVRKPAHLSGDDLIERLGSDLLKPMLRASGARPMFDGHDHGGAAPDKSPPRSFGAERSGAPRSSAVGAGRSAAYATPVGAPCRVVGIGVSTGGPIALHDMLPRLPKDFSQPIVIVQHMPATFTASLAKSLDRVCALPVKEAETGDEVMGGRVLIAPGGRQMRVVRSGVMPTIEITDDPPECSCRPSVDYLFRSLAETYGKSALGVVLTGMGEDGWLGSRAIHEAGGRCIAQDEETSAVYGMPRGPIQAGIARAVPLQEVADTIAALAGSVRCS